MKFDFATILLNWKFFFEKSEKIFYRETFQRKMTAAVNPIEILQAVDE